MEFALVLPLLLFILLGAMGTGLVILNRMALQHAAYQVANEAAAMGDCAPAVARTSLILGYQPEEITCVITGQLATVTLTHTWPVLIPLLPETITVTATSFAGPPSSS